MHRREFLKTAGGALALAALATPALAAAAQESEASTRKRTLKKGIMWGTVDVKGSTLEKMKAIKEAGFDGFQSKPINVMEFLQDVDAMFSGKVNKP